MSYRGHPSVPWYNACNVILFFNLFLKKQTFEEVVKHLLILTPVENKYWGMYDLFALQSLVPGFKVSFSIFALFPMVQIQTNFWNS